MLIICTILQMKRLSLRHVFLIRNLSNLKANNARNFSLCSTKYSDDPPPPVTRSMFLSQFPELTRLLARDEDTPDLHPLLAPHLATLLEATVPGGKMNRGLSVPHTYSLLAASRGASCTARDLELASVLGWTVELLQAFFLVADDIMDGSVTRRGAPCWYRNTGVGLAAFNDSLILETCVYSVLRRYFRSEPCYLALLENMLQVTKFTTYGQSLDTMSANNFTLVRGQEGSLDSFTMDRYTAIVKYKTSFYSFYLPVSFAMNMSGYKDQRLYDKAKEILLDIGHYFQVTDDYLDCFGDPSVIGKIGTDIQDGKCSWLIVKALEIASEEEKKILTHHYGSHEETDISIIKQLYHKLRIQQHFRDYESDFYQSVMSKIDSVSDEFPKEVFTTFLDKVYKRNM